MRAFKSKILTTIAIMTMGGLLVSCGDSVEGDFGDPTASDQPTSQPAPQPTSAPASQPTSPTAPAVDPRIAQGNDLFNNGFCVKCHGQGATGGKNGPALAGRRWIHNDGSLAGIASTIQSGVSEDEISDSRYTRAMKPGKLTSDEFQAVAAYLLSLQ